ncbi:unnamed protein product [Lactuca virosa]|uniref:Uncharacterized protein n=1 Tax=Lactuca virosa TaxID=75947 RepID=A0AAU9M778_9ASTR|nr:unnamed protein product [Lactuca virosa]
MKILWFSTTSGDDWRWIFRCSCGTDLICQRADLKKKWWLAGADMSWKEDTTITMVVHHISGSRFETPTTYVSVIVGGWRLRCGGVVSGGVTSGETVVDGGGCGGVHHKWLKEVKGFVLGK